MHNAIQEDMDREHAGGVIGGTESTPHKEKYLHHLDQQLEHEKHAGKKREGKYTTVGSFMNHPKGPSRGTQSEQKRHAKEGEEIRSRLKKDY